MTFIVAYVSMRIIADGVMEGIDAHSVDENGNKDIALSFHGEAEFEFVDDIENKKKPEFIWDNDKKCM